MSLTLDRATTALVFIDLQNGILAMPLAPHSAEDVLAATRALSAAARQAGMPVVHVRVDLAQLAPPLSDWPLHDPTAPAPPPEASLHHEDAGLSEGDWIVTKRQWGAFHATELDQRLRRRGIRTIVLGGVVTNFGVESTARAAVEHGYAVVSVEDATSGVDPAMHAFAFEQMFPFIGRVVTSADVLGALAA